MKLNIVPSQIVSTGGLTEQKAFKIEANGQAFKILSSGLYSDKVGAVVREIGCNAYDAHVSVGKQHIPFQVKLPNALDNEFYIRDFGPGLSQADVMNLYTTYFASTKGESNDFTGAFGLGSKSPFSYTDSFTITSWHDGVKKIYSAHIGAEGSPMVAVLSSEPCETTETGISIGFPVRPTDYAAFVQRAKQTYQYFATIPEVVAGEPITKPAELSDCGDFFHNPPPGYDDAPCAIIMGNVWYPIDTNQIEGNDATDRLKNIILKVPIGAVQVTASREHLEYTKATQEYLRAQLQKTLGVCILEIVAMYQSLAADGTWKAICEYRKHRSRRIGVSVDAELMVQYGVNSALAKKIAQANQSYIDWPTLQGLSIYEKAHGNRRTSRGDIVLKNYLPSRAYCSLENNITIIWQDAKNPVGRIRKALTEGTLTGRIALCDDLTIANNLEQTFKGVAIRALSEFDAPASTAIKGTRRKKGQAPSLPLKLENSSKKYILTRTRSSWGKHSTRMYHGEHEWEEDTWHHYVRRLKGLSETLPELQTPVELTYRDFRQYKIDARPDWQPYYDHVREVLENQNTRHVLQKMYDAVHQRVSLHDNERGLFGILCWLHGRGLLQDGAMDVLRKHGIWKDVVETVQREQNAPPRTTELAHLNRILSSYYDMHNPFGITAKGFETTVDPMAHPMNEKFAVASDTPPEVYEHLATSIVFPEFLNLVLSKGAS